MSRTPRRWARTHEQFHDRARSRRRSADTDPGIQNTPSAQYDPNTSRTLIFDTVVGSRTPNNGTCVADSWGALRCSQPALRQAPAHLHDCSRCCPKKMPRDSLTVFPSGGGMGCHGGQALGCRADSDCAASVLFIFGAKPARRTNDAHTAWANRETHIEDTG